MDMVGCCTHICFVGDVADDAGDDGHVAERQPCGTGCPSEILVAVLVRVYAGVSMYAAGYTAVNSIDCHGSVEGIGRRVLTVVFLQRRVKVKIYQLGQ